jgi:hypothetical protein
VPAEVAPELLLAPLLLELPPPLLLGSLFELPPPPQAASTMRGAINATARRGEKTLLFMLGSRCPWTGRWHAGSYD